MVVAPGVAVAGIPGVAAVTPGATTAAAGGTVDTAIIAGATTVIGVAITPTSTIIIMMTATATTPATTAVGYTHGCARITETATGWVSETKSGAQWRSALL